MTLSDLSTTLQKQKEIKQDFITPAAAIEMNSFNEIVFNKELLKPNYVFHQHLSEKLGIPKGYYDKCINEGDGLLSHNVNHWLQSAHKNGHKFLLRTWMGDEKIARALLSNRHHMIDNLPVLLETLQAIEDAGLRDDIVISKCVLNDERMFVEFTCPVIEVEAKELLHKYNKAIEVGFGIIAGFLLENSEVGKGAFKLTPRAVIKACKNGAINTKQALKKIHLGSTLTDGLDLSGIEEVREANIKLIRTQLKHAVKHFLTKEYLDTLVKHYESIGLPQIQAPVNKITEVIATNFGWTEDDSQKLLMRYVEGGDSRRIGIYNAMTFVAQSFDEGDKYDAEVAAWNVLNDFERIEKLAIRKMLMN